MRLRFGKISGGIVFVFISMMFFLCGMAESSDVIVSGGWTSLVIGGNGRDMERLYESPPAVASISVMNTKGRTWRLSVRSTGPVTFEDLDLRIRRNGDGNSSRPLRGGRGYVRIGPSDVSFFSGTGDVLNVPVQLRLGGVSKETPTGTRSVNLLYTVVNVK